MCVCRMANAFQGEEDVRGRTLHTRWQEHRGMPCHGAWLWMLLPPVGSLFHCHRCHSPRPTPSSDLSSNTWPSTGSLKTHLPTCRLWYTKHLQILVQKKNRKNTPNTTRAQQKHRLLCSCCSERLHTRLDLGAAGPLCQELSVPLRGSVGSQCQGVPANHQVQLISSL